MQVLEDAIQYDNFGRMKYHPDFHPNHGKPITEEDLEYLCKFWEIDHRRSISFALGRTEHTLQTKVHDIRKQGLFDHYKNLNKNW